LGFISGSVFGHGGSTDTSLGATLAGEGLTQTCGVELDLADGLGGCDPVGEGNGIDFGADLVLLVSASGGTDVKFGVLPGVLLGNLLLANLNALVLLEGSTGLLNLELGHLNNLLLSLEFGVSLELNLLPLANGGLARFLCDLHGLGLLLVNKIGSSLGLLIGFLVFGSGGLHGFNGVSGSLLGDDCVLSSLSGLGLSSSPHFTFLAGGSLGLGAELVVLSLLGLGGLTGELLSTDSGFGEGLGFARSTCLRLGNAGGMPGGLFLGVGTLGSSPGSGSAGIGFLDQLLLAPDLSLGYGDLLGGLGLSSTCTACSLVSSGNLTVVRSDVGHGHSGSGLSIGLQAGLTSGFLVGRLGSFLGDVSLAVSLVSLQAGGGGLLVGTGDVGLGDRGVGLGDAHESVGLSGLSIGGVLSSDVRVGLGTGSVDLSTDGGNLGFVLGNLLVVLFSLVLESLHVDSVGLGEGVGIALLGLVSFVLNKHPGGFVISLGVLEGSLGFGLFVRSLVFGIGSTCCGDFELVCSLGGCGGLGLSVVSPFFGGGGRDSSVSGVLFSGRGINLVLVGGMLSINPEGSGRSLLGLPLSHFIVLCSSLGLSNGSRVHGNVHLLLR